MFQRVFKTVFIKGMEILKSKLSCVDTKDSEVDGLNHFLYFHVDLWYYL